MVFFWKEGRIPIRNVRDGRYQFFVSVMKGRDVSCTFRHNLNIFDFFERLMLNLSSVRRQISNLLGHASRSELSRP